MTRKYLKEFKQIYSAVILIQKVWRGYRVRKQNILHKRARDIKG